jgi:Protein of unknown function (DUF3037)
MQDKHLFEYAVIRVVPKVEREEFLNTGVVLFCAREKFLDAIIDLNEKRLHVFCSDCDLEDISEYLRSFKKICLGGDDAGPIGKLPLPERFRWLTATRSTVVQTSKVHSGFSNDLPLALKRLFGQLVLTSPATDKRG